MKRISILLLVISLTLAGCSNPYQACSKAGQVIANSVAAGDATILALAKDGSISAQEAISIAGYLEFVNQGDEVFLTCAKTAHTNGNVMGSYTACALDFTRKLSTPAELSLIHVSNLKSQAIVQTMVTGITSALTILQSSLGGQ